MNEANFELEYRLVCMVVYTATEARAQPHTTCRLDYV